MSETPVTREWADGLWRSEDMVLVSMTIQREVAHRTIREIGELGICEFRDLNGDISLFQREYTADIRRCEEADRRLRYFQEQLELAGAMKTDSRIRFDPHVVTEDEPSEMTLDELDRRLDDLDNRLRDKQTRYTSLLEQRNRTLQYLEILDCTGDFLRGAPNDAVASAGSLQYLTGVIPTARLFGFERAVYRASRGNFFIRTRPIAQMLEDPVTRQPVHYTVFVVFFAAQRVHDLVRKLADSVGAVVYDVPSPAMAEGARHDLRAELKSHDHAQAAWESDLGGLLSLIAANLPAWSRAVAAEKAIAQTLNLLRFTGATASAEAWVPKKYFRELRDALANAAAAGSAQVESLCRIIPTTATPPTFFDTNKFTSNFQQIVDSYGVARYKEVNPGVLTIVTFPFLFGIMYGDIGHGLIMVFIASLLVIFEKRLASVQDEMFQMLFGGRYLILLMSFFSVYIGILYNDCFSLMVGSSTQWSFKGAEISIPDPVNPAANITFNCMEFPEGHEYHALSNSTREAMQAGCSSHFRSGVMADFPGYGNGPAMGVDPGWAGSSNRLDFLNSYKMKQAVILGVIHMLSGVVLSLLNHLHNKDMTRVYFQFIPEVIFLVFTFGWMDFLIIIKWFTYWKNPFTAPPLLSEMTNFFLAPGSPPSACYYPPGGSVPDCPADSGQGYWHLFSGQFQFQVFLVLVAVLAIPLLLFPIPCIAYRKMKAEADGGGIYQVHDEEMVETDDPHSTGAHGGDHGEHHDFSEIVIHQIIHTIEYVLGCVSNTASYLRLWALSLAHAQLAEVFWDFTILTPLEFTEGAAATGVMIFLGYGAWICITMGVLVGMEGLSAFLHALRLHWVEFQNKFYMGDGYAFAPLVLKRQ